MLQAWRGVVAEQAHVVEPAELRVHELVGLVGVGVAQTVQVRGAVGVAQAGDVVPRGGGVAQGRAA